VNKSTAVEAEPNTCSSDPSVASYGQGCFVLRCPPEMICQARTALLEFLVASTGNVTPRELILDLKDVAFLNSVGVGAIFSVRKHVVEAGGEMAICNVKPTVRRLLAAVNLPALIPVLGDLGLAHGFFDQARGPQ